MKKIEAKSVLNCEMGKALSIISIFVLIFGMVEAIILFSNSHIGGSYSYPFDPITFSMGLALLIGSIFIFIFGRTIAKISNHIEAIYKNVNPDFELDAAIELKATFLTNDYAMAKDGENFVKVKIINVRQEQTHLVYDCEKESGEVLSLTIRDLKQCE